MRSCGLKSQSIELEPGLPNTETPGDWVVRTGVEKTALAKQLEKILQDELSLPVRLEFREVNRPVYVARGNYRLTPLPGHKATSKLILTDETLTTDEIEIFGKELVPNSGAGGGTDHFDVFLDWLGRWIGTPIVSEVTKLPSNQLSWHLQRAIALHRPNPSRGSRSKTRPRQHHRPDRPEVRARKSPRENPLRRTIKTITAPGATGSASALLSPQLAARTLRFTRQSPILGHPTLIHQNSEKIFVEIGPALVLTCALKCPSV